MIDEDLIYILVGKKIREKREAAGLSQVKLAEAIEVSRASLANYESGNTSVYISYLYLIAEHLKVDVRDFLPSMEEIRDLTSHEKRLENQNVNTKEKLEVLEFIQKVEEGTDNG